MDRVLRIITAIRREPYLVVVPVIVIPMLGYTLIHWGKTFFNFLFK